MAEIGDACVLGALPRQARCARCRLRRRATGLLPAGTGTVLPRLSGVLDAVTAARQPRSALNWLREVRAAAAALRFAGRPG